MKHTIQQVSDSEFTTTSGALEQNLLDSLASSNAQALNTSFTLAVHDEEGALIGGVVAACSYSWMNVKILWVAAGHRRRGIGHDLMSHAHRKAEKLGCHSAWLDTSDHDARDFYETLGYYEFGLLANQAADFPPTHRRWFMQRRL